MFTFGSDPEFMLVDDKGNLRSAIKVVEGTSEERIQVKGHEFYYDNVLAECAIKPATGRANVLESFRECFEIYAELVSPYVLVPRAYSLYPDAQLDDEAARRVGCSRDRCAYKVKEMKAPEDIITKTSARSGGGHVHLGPTNFFPNGTKEKNNIHNDCGLYLAPTVVLMDLFLGVTSAYIDHDPTSAQRREIYGQAGRYRIKDYGFEYRTLGNFWLASPRLVGFIYDVSEVVLDIVQNKFEQFCSASDDVYCSPKPSKAYKYTFDINDVRDSINTGKKSKLISLVVENLPQGLVTDFENLSKPQSFDLYKEWGL